MWQKPSDTQPDYSRGWQSNNTDSTNFDNPQSWQGYNPPGQTYSQGQGWQNYNPGPDYYQAYPGYSYSQYYQAPPQRRKRGGGWLVFLVIALLVVAAGYFASGYLESKQRAKPLPVTGSEGEGNGWSFEIQPNDPLYDNQYALQHVNAAAAWNITKGSPNVVVAVIDTGVDASHPDLQGKLVKGYDFVNNDDTPEDTVGHGTFVASLIAATGNDKNGIVGLAPGVKIMPLKVLDKTGGNSLLIAQAIRYAADNGAKVINLSLGGPTPSRAILQATNYAISKNVVVVASSGNDGSRRNPVEYPASFPDVISVGATGPTDKIASFSTHNSGVNVAAPGVNILGARSSNNSICRPYQGTAYCMASGTSFSAPYVSATAALMLSVNPNLTPQQVDQLLEKTATDLGPSGPDDYYGAGLINAGKAVAAAKQ
jgi:type VII secretion-associated serine protease mycosin